MRPRLIASVPGLGDASFTPFERFEKFTRMIMAIPKLEADKKSDKAVKRTASRKKSKGV